MTQDTQKTLRLNSEQLERWKEVHRATFPEHGVSFSQWILLMVERGIERPEVFVKIKETK